MTNADIRAAWLREKRGQHYKMYIAGDWTGRRAERGWHASIRICCNHGAVCPRRMQRMSATIGKVAAARHAREEIVGPVACLIRFGDEEEAIRIANDTEFGPAAGSWPENLRRVPRVIPRMR